MSTYNECVHATRPYSSNTSEALPYKLSSWALRVKNGLMSRIRVLIILVCLAIPLGWHQNKEVACAEKSNIT